MNTIRVALADDETLIRKGIALLLGGLEGIVIVMEAENGKDLLKQLSETPQLPDIILLDLKMPEMNGVETAKILAKRHPEIKVVVLSTYFSKSFIFNMIENGVAAYLPKNTQPEEFEQTLKSVQENGFHYSREVMAALRESLIHNKKLEKLTFDIQLTKREREILQLICEQYTNQEIAEKLFLSVRTVDGHRASLLQKLNCRNTAGLVAFAIQQELVQVDPSRFWQ